MLRIRLRRVGGKNAPAYRIVVSDGRRTPLAKVVEELGHYDPTKNPPTLKFDRDKAKKWIEKGAVASDTIRRLLVKNA
jgi:small subunit ribosomal protein S16